MPKYLREDTVVVDELDQEAQSLFAVAELCLEVVVGTNYTDVCSKHWLIRCENIP